MLNVYRCACGFDECLATLFVRQHWVCARITQVSAVMDSIARTQGGLYRPGGPASEYRPPVGPHDKQTRRKLEFVEFSVQGKERK